MQFLLLLKLQIIKLNAGILCLLLISLVSCRSTSVTAIAKFNERPDLGSKWCISDGTGFCEDGEQEHPTKNMFCGDADKGLAAKKHLEAMERYRWRCLKYRKCRK